MYVPSLPHSAYQHAHDAARLGWAPAGLLTPTRLRPSAVVSAGTSIKCPAQGLTPGMAYLVTATATLASKSTTSPTTNALPLVMPVAGAPALVTAADTGPTSGAATASPPNGVSFTRVRLPPAAAGSADGSAGLLALLTRMFHSWARVWPLND